MGCDGGEVREAGLRWGEARVSRLLVTSAQQVDVRYADRINCAGGVTNLLRVIMLGIRAVSNTGCF